MLIWTGGSGRYGYGQLGLVDSKQNILELVFKLEASPKSTPRKADAKKISKSGSKKQVVDAEVPCVKVNLAQDLSALKSRKGDTGEWSLRPLGRLLIHPH